MAISKTKKQDILAQIEKIVAESKNITFVNFHGVSVLNATEIRKQLRENNIGYLVAKKSLVKKALGSKAIKGTLPSLDGELAIAYSVDQISPAREIFSFQKKFENRVSILGGVFEDEYKNQEEMVAIASIPSLQALRGMFVNVINSPIQGLVIALQAIADKKQA